MTRPGWALLLDHLRREQGLIGGIVHLLPLADHAAFETMDLAAGAPRCAVT